MVVVVAVITTIALRDRQRSRALAHLDDERDHAAAGRAAAEADAEHSRTEGLARSAHQGITGAGGTTPGA